MDYKDINDYELIYMVRENDEISKNTLFTKYDAVIKKIASKYYDFAKTKGADFDDLFQEGCIGLYSAVCSFDETQKCKFYTFACICIDRYISSFCKKIKTNKNEMLNQALIYDFDEVAKNVSFSNNYSYLNEHDFFESIIDKLSFKQSCVFELKYNGFSYSEISQLLDIPINTVDSRLCKVRKILQKL